MRIDHGEKEIFAKICSRDRKEMLHVVLCQNVKELLYFGVNFLTNSDKDVIHDITATSFHDTELVILYLPKPIKP